MANSPLLLQSVVMEKHITTRRAISPDHVHIRPTFIRIDHRGCLCRNCWVLLTEEQWIAHRKAQTCQQPKHSGDVGNTNGQGEVSPNELLHLACDLQ
jgi:hypothetical protein